MLRPNWLVVSDLFIFARRIYHENQNRYTKSALAVRRGKSNSFGKTFVGQMDDKNIITMGQLE